MLPLRLFLGVSFAWAGLAKLADPHFLSSNYPLSVEDQIAQNIPSSPITPILRLAAHQTLLIGIVVALGELAVGLGTLLGLWSRVAALGGSVLSAVFLLATSWHTSPIYQSPDLAYLMAWTPLLLGGAGGVASLDERFGQREGRRSRIPPFAAIVGLRLTARARRGRIRATVIFAIIGAGLAGTVALVGRLISTGR